MNKVQPIGRKPITKVNLFKSTVFRVSIYTKMESFTELHLSSGLRQVQPSSQSNIP